MQVDIADRFAGICTPGAVWPADAIAEVAAAPDGAQACLVRTALGAEVNLVLTIPGKGP